MGIPESKFNDWKSTGADVGSKRARKSIYNALRSDRSPLEQKDGQYDVFLQGSYANSTHTRGNSDIDVVVKLTSSWDHDLSELSQEEKERYHRNHSPADYQYEDFRKDVYKAIKTKYGTWNVSWNDKAIKVDRDSTSLSVDADVIPCSEYRVYHSYPAGSEPNFTSGMHFTPKGFGTSQIVNFPRKHIQNGRAKNARAGGNYKETVRIFKNARDYVDKKRLIFSFNVASYFIECLLYNVNDRLFRTTSRSDRFNDIVQALENSDLGNFEQQCGMGDLFGRESTQWTTSDAEKFIREMRKLWDNW